MAVFILVAGCGVDSVVVPFPGDSESVYRGGRYFGTAADDVWFVDGSAYVHWNGQAWSHVADLDYSTEPDGSPADLQHTSVHVAGPGLVVITEFNGQIFTLDTSGARTDLGEPLQEPYSASFTVSGFEGVVYAYQTSAPSVPEGTSPVFRRDADGWVELPIPPGDTFGGGEVWATGPDVVWFSGAGLALWDGAAWREYPGVYLGSSANWLAVAPTRIASAGYDEWAFAQVDETVAL